jgi:uncharacterized protein
MRSDFACDGKRLRVKPICVRLLLVVCLGCLNVRTEATTVGRAGAKTSRPAPETKRLRLLAIRLRPGQDLRKGIEDLVAERNIRAGFVMTAVGSLQTATIRLADQKEPTKFAGKFEIVSLVGTLGPDGVHLHVSIADSEGRTIGGHLVEGCLIYTTAEIVIGDAQGLTFSREQDEHTGSKELRIRRRQQSRK